MIRTFSFAYNLLRRRLRLGLLRDNLSQSAARLDLLEQQGKLVDGNTQTAHDVHDLGVFLLRLFLLQTFQLFLQLRNFGLVFSISASVFAVLLIAIYPIPPHFVNRP